MASWRVPGYAQVRVLGSGGFGEVIAARHEATGTLVAVKYLRGELLADPLFAGMFRGEAAALAGLDDPHVVRLFEYVESGDGAAIVMELVDGVSLREVLARYGSTGPEAALAVLRGSLMGLAAAHRAGVVHRDYKPENVLVDGQGASKLTDFGLAARSGDRPLPAGTLAYAAPEQVAGWPATPAADVYAATATFYECITGRPPFTGDDPAGLARQHQTEPVPLEDVPVPLRPLVAAGMAKNPADRPADAAVLAARIEEAAVGGYGPDWHRRGRARLGEAALLLAGLWPAAGTSPAAQGTALHHIALSQQPGTPGTGTGNLSTGTSGTPGTGTTPGTGPGTGTTPGTDGIPGTGTAPGTGGTGTAPGTGTSPGTVPGAGPTPRVPSLLRRMLRPVVIGVVVVVVAIGITIAVKVTGGHNAPLYGIVASLRAPAAGSQYVYSVRYSPDGAVLAAGYQDGDTYLWNVATGQVAARLAGHRYAVDSVAFSPDGQIVATCDFNGSTYLWHVSGGRLISSVTDPGTKGCLSVAFTADGNVMATGDKNGSAYLWDVATGKLLGNVTDPSNTANVRDGLVGVLCVAFSPNDKTLATADASGSTYLWHIPAGSLSATLTDPGGFDIPSVIFSPDGLMIATADVNDRSAFLWNLATGKLIRTFHDPGGQHIVAVAFSPDGKTLATASDYQGGAFLWDITTGTRLASLRSPGSTHVFSVAFSPDGRTLAAGSDHGRIFIWNVEG